MSEIAVKIQDVERTYGSGSNAVHVLRGVNLEVAGGQLVALYGPSGSGKTTLLNLIGALDRPSNGIILIGGKDVVRMSDSARAKLRRTQIGFIFQSDVLIPSYTAFENVDLALRLLRLSHGERRRRTQAALEVLGLAEWANHMPDEMSGGQRQRVAIARALALRPSLILADEPTTGLDTRVARRTLALFGGISKKQGTTFILATHDPMIAELVDTVYDLRDGQLFPRSAELPAEKQPVTEAVPG